MPRAFDSIFIVQEDGGLPADTWLDLVEHAKLFAGRKMQVRINSPKRSTRANAYYWGVAITVITGALREAGKEVTSEELHNYFKCKYLNAVPAVNAFGIEIVKAPTTTTLTSTEFFDYVENVRTDQLVMLLRIHIPEPEENYRSFAIANP